MDPDNISAELTSTCNAVENLMTEAKQKARDLPNFVENQLGPSCGPSISIYAELEENVTSNFRHASGKFYISNIHSKFVYTVQDSFENLLTVESAWNTFLSAVDAKLQGPVTVGGSVQMARELTNAR